MPVEQVKLSKIKSQPHQIVTFYVTVSSIKSPVHKKLAFPACQSWGFGLVPQDGHHSKASAFDKLEMGLKSQLSYNLYL